MQGAATRGLFRQGPQGQPSYFAEAAGNIAAGLFSLAFAGLVNEFTRPRRSDNRNNSRNQEFRFANNNYKFGDPVPEHFGRIRNVPVLLRPTYTNYVAGEAIEDNFTGNATSANRKINGIFVISNGDVQIESYRYGKLNIGVDAMQNGTNPLISFRKYNPAGNVNFQFNNINIMQLNYNKKMYSVSSDGQTLNQQSTFPQVLDPFPSTVRVSAVRFWFGITRRQTVAGDRYARIRIEGAIDGTENYIQLTETFQVPVTNPPVDNVTQTIMRSVNANVSGNATLRNQIIRFRVTLLVSGSDNPSDGNNNFQQTDNMDVALIAAHGTIGVDGTSNLTGRSLVSGFDGHTVIEAQLDTKPTAKAAQIARSFNDSTNNQLVSIVGTRVLNTSFDDMVNMEATTSSTAAFRYCAENATNKTPELETLQAIEQDLSPQFNYVFDSLINLQSVFNTICATFRGKPLILGETLTAIYVNQQDEPEVVFTEGHIIKDSLGISYNPYSTQLLSTISGTYQDDINWAVRTIRGSTDSSTTINSRLGSRTRLDLNGFTDATRVEDYIGFLLRSSIYTRRNISFVLEFDALTIRPGDVIGVQHSRLNTSSYNTIESYEVVEEDDGTYTVTINTVYGIVVLANYISIINFNGLVEATYPITRNSSTQCSFTLTEEQYNSLIRSTGSSFDDQLLGQNSSDSLVHLIFNQKSDASDPDYLMFRVESVAQEQITGSDGLYFRVNAVIYDSRVFTDTNNYIEVRI